LSASAPSVVEAIESKLREEEWLVSAWSPVHLNRVLNQWYFKEGVTEVSALKVWQDSCQYLYLPRLLNSPRCLCTPWRQAAPRAMGLPMPKGQVMPSQACATTTAMAARCAARNHHRLTHRQSSRLPATMSASPPTLNTTMARCASSTASASHAARVGEGSVAFIWACRAGSLWSQRNRAVHLYYRFDS
jgi:hypothetical protein